MSLHCTLYVETIALAFALTKAMEDNLYDRLCKIYKALARSMAHSKQVKVKQL